MTDPAVRRTPLAARVVPALLVRDPNGCYLAFAQPADGLA